MALTQRQNGTTSASLVTASWWNDYYALLVGTMTDQPVTLKTSQVNQAVANNPTTGPTATVVSGSSLGVGAYKYVVTFSGVVGETAPSPATAIATTSGNQNVNLSAIPTGPTGTTARNIYRTLVGGSVYHKFTTISDNTTTTYSDTQADSAISATASPLVRNMFGGYLELHDASGGVNAGIYSDGSLVGTGLYSSGSSLALNTLFTRPGTPNDSIGYGLNGSNDAGIMVGGSGAAVSLGTTNSIWMKLNNYYDGTNDRFWAASTAYQFTFTNTGILQGRQSSSSPVAGGIISWASFRPYTPVWTGTTDPGGNAQEGDVWIRA